MKSLLALSVMCGCVFLIGCGGGEPAPVSISDGTNEQALKELAEVYKYIAYEKKPAPRSAADLAELEGSLPVALPKIQSGELVVIWKGGYSASSTGLQAHEKGAASGGFVLLRNGTVKSVTAEEFAQIQK